MYIFFKYGQHPVAKQKQYKKLFIVFFMLFQSGEWYLHPSVITFRIEMELESLVYVSGDYRLSAWKTNWEKMSFKDMYCN